MRWLAIPDAAAMLARRPSEVRALVEDGRLDAVRVRGRWLISFDSVVDFDPAVRKADPAGAPEADLRELEARVAELERRLESFENTEPADDPPGGLRPALQPLFRTTK